MPVETAQISHGPRPLEWTLSPCRPHLWLPPTHSYPETFVDSTFQPAPIIRTSFRSCFRSWRCWKVVLRRKCSGDEIKCQPSQSSLRGSSQGLCAELLAGGGRVLRPRSPNRCRRSDDRLARGTNEVTQETYMTDHASQALGEYRVSKRWEVAESDAHHKPCTSFCR
jgi:hypothetical protein